MKVGRIVGIIVLVGLLGLLVTELVMLMSQSAQLNKQNADVAQRLQAVQDENAHLQEGIVYYSIPQNLEKDLRQKFNYIQPGERMIIVVPSTPTTSISY